MHLISNHSHETLKADLSHFHPLQNKTLAEYSIIYHKNVGYRAASLESVASHEALLFKKFENATQQANLFLEYTSLPIMIADLAICVLQGKVSYLKDYPKAANYRLLAKEKENEHLYTIVLKRMLLKFLTSGISKKTAWLGDSDMSKIFCIKPPNSDLHFFPHLQFGELIDLLFNTTNLKINLTKSKVGNQTVKLCMEFWSF